MAVVTPTAKAQFIDAAGIPLAGGFLYTYAAGSTTPQATYTDSTSSTANSNPIVLDSRGEANIWLASTSYKFKLCDSTNTEIWTVDNIAPPSTALSPVFTTNVTISDSSPGPALLISQAGAGPAIRVQDQADPDASPFIVDTTGQVGIGTAAPANALDVAGGAIQISTSGGTARTVMSADSTDSIFSVNDDRNFTVKTNTATRLTINSTAATSTLPVVLPSDPTTALQAATKQYADTKAAGSTTITGGTSITTSGTLASGVTVSVTAGGITSTQLANNAVTTTNITDSNVTTAKINNAAVTAAKLSGAQSGSAPVYGARAWASVTSGGSISASGNVSSITKGSTGIYQVNFTTNMSSSNYAAVATPTGAKNIFCDINSRSSSSCTVETFSDSGSNVDSSFCLVVME
jgi:hypothetical protein